MSYVYVAVVTAAAGAYTTTEATRQAKRQADKAVEAQTRSEKLFEAGEARRKKQAAFAIMKRRGGGESPGRSTVLTSPLGATGQAGVAGKTLLGQ